MAYWDKKTNILSNEMVEDLLATQDPEEPSFPLQEPINLIDESLFWVRRDLLDIMIILRAK